MKLKRIEEYDNGAILEYRTPGSKNKKSLGPNTETVVPGEKIKPDETLAAVGKDVVALDNYNDFVGVPADDNPSDGSYDVDAPSLKDKELFKKRSQWTKDYKMLWAKIVGKQNFFVQGEAGWAKSAVIKQMAKKAGYTVITVFMDKALPEDLDGIPVVRDHGGRVVQKKIMPVWAQYMYDRPDTQFLLFFDELNQAPNDVMNAMMPIAHKDRIICGKKFKNYFCGAAGNLDSENDLNQIRRPVMARFGNRPIRWVTGLSTDKTEARTAWENAFDYLHEKWDDKIGEKLIDEFKKVCLSYNPSLFAAPRDLENDCFEQLYEFKNSTIDDDDYERFDVETIYEILKGVTNTAEGVQYDMKNSNEFTNRMKQDLDKLADKCYNYILKYKKEGARNFDDELEKTKKDEDIVDTFEDSMIDKMINLIAFVGEIEGKDEYNQPFIYPVTPELIQLLFPKLEKETLDFIEREMKKRKLTWVYPDNAAAIKTGRWTSEQLN